MLPHMACPHGATRIAAVFSATSQSPVGSAANAGPVRQANVIAARHDFRILSSAIAQLFGVQRWRLNDGAAAVKAQSRLRSAAQGRNATKQ
jgi:hypothetical protein